MELIGVVHDPKFVDNVDRYIAERHPEGIESLMLELPSNWLKIPLTYKNLNSFFDELRRRYEQKGVRIIYGDVSVYCPPIEMRSVFNDISATCRMFLDDLRTDLYTLARKRDKIMVQAILNEKPQVVVVGRDHADYIKDVFPDAYYVAFVRAKQRNRPNKPNRIIPLSE